MKRSYVAALHAMQSGVKKMMELRLSFETEPKHLRVGINVAMSDEGGLVDLLVSKGIITREEYYAAITARMEQEVIRYEQILSEKLGRPVTLE